MDLMELRRGLMMAMAGGGSIFDSLLEIVDSITPLADADSITFTSDNSQGAYFVFSNPPGNRTEAQNSSKSQTINAISFSIRESNLFVNNSATTYRQTPTATLDIDWWTNTLAIGDGTVTITSARSNVYQFMQGTTYYLVRVKST